MPNDSKRFKSESGAAVTPFSKNLMGLKFMQNAKAKLDKSVELEPVVIESTHNPGYHHCELLKLGRMSFKGMNPRIETLQEQFSASNDTSFNASSGQLTDISFDDEVEMD